MKKFRVEFNITGFYSGQGIWEALDDTVAVEAETAQEAIDSVIDWLEYDEPECHEYAWRAAERTERGKHHEHTRCTSTRYGVELGEWEFKEEE